MNNSDYNKAENAVNNVENLYRMQRIKPNGKSMNWQTEPRLY
jgi:hypothetical protein